MKNPDENSKRLMVKNGPKGNLYIEEVTSERTHKFIQNSYEEFLHSI